MAKVGKSSQHIYNLNKKFTIPKTVYKFTNTWFQLLSSLYSRKGLWSEHMWKWVKREC